MSCADCSAEVMHGRVMVAMKPGRDKQEWFLCVRCYVESTREARKVRR